MIARRSLAGFTLVEVTVAFVILGLAAGALIPVLGASPARLARGNGQMTAVLATRSVLAELDARDTLKAGELSGRLQDNVTWKAQIRPFSETPGAAGSTQTLTTPYLVSVEATVETATKPAMASVTTVRLQRRLP
jgi:general secretion pathway protein I